ncbi:hypothetical protein M409DRAFT_30743 [Zasmidium cellare ATCC 36951]|uniref:F-box domain-containing protein n=1 Tax=Zasmidium cellare ATCC 36951 TaxID=1080233 RepID=A0A6A6BVQ8_ZASCE|nr:uncharacterized protein M409DRAFT_30743 [Zasmidium cellare ATCC 36951]KAF2158785.1 hypothetical protein M409DRAFT_30743 [Zasmidium cellare ATCC 36951]
MPAATQAKPSLDALPPELIEAIACELPTRDIFSLQLTCFTIARRIEHHFTRTYYRHAGFLLDSPNSIKMAIDFARHPAVGPALREITFFIDKIANPHTTTEPLHIEPTERLMLMRWLRNRFWEDHQPFLDPETQRQDIEVLLLELKLHGKLNRIIFGELHSSTQVPVFDKGEAGPSIANIAEVMRDVLLRPELANPSVELVLAAMTRIGMPSVQSIEMAGPRVIWLALLPPCQLNLYRQAFASPRRLCLYLCDTHLGAATSNVQYFTILSQGERQAHYKATLQGGVIGGLVGLSAGALCVYLASRSFQGFRNITLAWRGYMITSAGTFGAVKAADYSSHRYEALHHPDRAYHQNLDTLQKELYRQQPLSQRLGNWATRNQYSVVFGSWAVCLGASWNLLNRNPYLTKPQKLVQARVFAQGLTVAMVVVALALQNHSKTAAHGSEHGSEEHYSKLQEQWKDMMDAEEEYLDEQGLEHRGVPAAHRRARPHFLDQRDMRQKATDQLRRWQVEGVPDS